MSANNSHKKIRINMIKYINRFIWATFFIFLGMVGVGYYNGMRLNNYQEFISTVISKISKKEVESTDKKKDKLKTTKNENQSKDKKVVAFERELQPAPKNPFAKIDKYARQCPKAAAESLESLSNYLQVGMESDLDKARAIFVWLTENIVYDDDSFNSGVYGDNSAEGVLASKKAVCGGFSNLFLALGQRMELEIEKVVGYAKGYGYSLGMKFKEPNHAWNVIKIDGNWRVFDATWGQGYGENVNGRLQSKQEFDEYWFNVDPFEAIFNHFPQDSKHSFVQPSLSLSRYEKFPNIDKEYFAIGFSGKGTYKNVSAEISSKFPQCFKLGTFVQMYAAPKKENLLINEPQKFEFFIPRGFSVAIIDGDNNWAYFDKEKGKFRLEYTPKTEGELQISVKFENGGDSYHTMLIYKVVKQRESG
jgi:Transglutaminase-like superfamily